MSFSIEKMLHYALESGASDLHLSTGSIPMVRIHGEMKKLQLPEMNNSSMASIAKEILNDNQQGVFKENLEIDFSTELKGKGRFRVNFFQQLNGISAVFRTIPSVIKSTEELGIPPILNQLAELDRGFVLMTGPTGSGKSTTLGIILNVVNKTSGSFSWFNGTLSTHEALKKVGAIIERPNFYPYMSAYQNLELICIMGQIVFLS